MTNADKYIYEFTTYTQIKFDSMVRNGFVFERNLRKTYMAQPTQSIAPLNNSALDDEIAKLPMDYKMFLAAQYVISLVRELSEKYQYELMATDILAAKGAVIYSAMRAGVSTDMVNDAFIRAGQHVLQNIKKYNNFVQQKIFDAHNVKAN